MFFLPTTRLPTLRTRGAHHVARVKKEQSGGTPLCTSLARRVRDCAAMAGSPTRRPHRRGARAGEPLPAWHRRGARREPAACAGERGGCHVRAHRVEGRMGTRRPAWLLLPAPAPGRPSRQCWILGSARFVQDGQRVGCHVQHAEPAATCGGRPMVRRPTLPLPLPAASAGNCRQAAAAP
jgi:hypothetical protein